MAVMASLRERGALPPPAATTLRLLRSAPELRALPDGALREAAYAIGVMEDPRLPRPQRPPQQLEAAPPTSALASVAEETPMLNMARIPGMLSLQSAQATSAFLLSLSMREAEGEESPLTGAPPPSTRLQLLVAEAASGEESGGERRRRRRERRRERQRAAQSSYEAEASPTPEVIARARAVEQTVLARFSNNRAMREGS